jgi:hypothetical protein
MSLSQKQILLQRITALKRLAKMAAAEEKSPKLSEIDSWAAELEGFIKMSSGH